MFHGRGSHFHYKQAESPYGPNTQGIVRVDQLEFQRSPSTSSCNPACILYVKSCFYSELLSRKLSFSPLLFMYLMYTGEMSSAMLKDLTRSVLVTMIYSGAPDRGLRIFSEVSKYEYGLLVKAPAHLGTITLSIYQVWDTGRTNSLPPFSKTFTHTSY